MTTSVRVYVGAATCTKTNLGIPACSALLCGSRQHPKMGKVYKRSISWVTDTQPAVHPTEWALHIATPTERSGISSSSTISERRVPEGARATATTIKSGAWNFPSE